MLTRNRSGPPLMELVSQWGRITLIQLFSLS
jgi:hypothetical protein